MIGSTNAPGAWALDLITQMASVQDALAGLSAQAGTSTIKPITIPRGRMRGDVDGDGVISQEDVELIKQYAASAVELDETAAWCCEIDGSAGVSGSDAAALGRFLAGTDDFAQADYYGNWTYDSTGKTWHTEVTVPGLTPEMSAVLAMSGQWAAGTFSGAEILPGKLRIASLHPPATDTQALLIHAPGNGEAVVVSTQKNDTGGLMDRLARAEAEIDSLTARLAEANEAADTAQSTANTALQLARNAQTAADAALDKITEVTNSIGAVPSQSGSLTYNGNAQSPTWNSYNQSVLTIGGTTSAIDAGSYQATFTPKEGYQWADGSKTAKTVTWTIARAAVAVPTQSGSLTYTGTEQTASFSGYDSSKMTISGTSKATNAGTYSATFTPGVNYRWDDSTTTAKTVTWTIGKAAGNLSINPTSLTIKSAATMPLLVTRSGDGAISATSSDTSVVTVSVSGSDTIAVTGKANGSATITVKVAAGTNHTAPATKTVSVSVSILSCGTTPTSGVSYTSGISTLTPEKLSGYAKLISDNSGITNTTTAVYIDDGNSHYKLSTGDKVAIPLDGTSYDFRIIGFNHDDLATASAYGENTVTGKAGITLDMVDCMNGLPCFHPSVDVDIGWKESNMRNDILPEKQASMPQEWQDVIKRVQKKAGVRSNHSGVETVLDYCFLLSVREIVGSGVPGVFEDGTQYAWYKDTNNSTIKFLHLGDESNWWTRSCASEYPRGCFVVTTNNRSFEIYTYTDNTQVSFAFCV